MRHSPEVGDKGGHPVGLGSAFIDREWSRQGVVGSKGPVINYREGGTKR